MTMQMKKLSAAIAAATLGSAMSMSVSAAAGDSGTVTFSKTIDPVCTMITTVADLSRTFPQTGTNGHFTTLSDSKGVNFDCNTDNVNVDVTLRLQGHAESQHKADVAVSLGDPQTSVDFVTDWLDTDHTETLEAETSATTIVSSGTAYPNPSTDSTTAAGGGSVETNKNGDITVTVGSEFIPDTGQNELKSAEYISKFKVTVTAL